MFSALDVRVTLIEPRDTFLDFIDKRIIQEFTHQIRDNGVDLRLGSAIEQIDDAGKHVEVSMANGRHVRAEMLLFAAGRMGATEKLNLDAVGIGTDHRSRVVPVAAQFMDRRRTASFHAALCGSASHVYG